MKRIILFSIAAFLISKTSNAQTSKEDLAIIQDVFQKDKTTLIRENLGLSESQGTAFWPVYEQYEAKRAALSRERAEILANYLQAYDTLTDQEATDLVKRTISNDQAVSKLQKSYLSKFSKGVGGKNTAKFYQLENYIQQIVRSDIQDQIPFIGELKN
jgi:hypothetical protein